MKIGQSTKTSCCINAGESVLRRPKKKKKKTYQSKLHEALNIKCLYINCDFF